MTVRQVVFAWLSLSTILAGSALGADLVDPTTGMELVLVKGGCFEMGDSSGDSLDNEKPAHEACVGDFYIGKHEVTQAQYLKIVGNDSSGFKGLCPNCPVVNVTVEDVRKFIDTLSVQSQLDFRLPYEDEWEFAAKGRNAKQRWAGTSDSKLLGDYAWFAGNGESQYHPVGSKLPNKLGLHDMSGNVAEWCEDIYSPSYEPNQLPVDPILRQSIRGGSWRDQPQQLRSSARSYLKPVTRPVHKATNGKYDVDLGFRLVVPAEKLRHKKLYAELSAAESPRISKAIRQLQGKNLSPRGQGELLLAAIGLMPEQTLQREIEALVEAGADLKIRDRQGRTPLLLLFDKVMGGLCCDKAEKEHGRAEKLAFKLATLLIEAGAEVNVRDTEGRSALARAAQLGMVTPAELLIEAGADVNNSDLQGQTPLMQACQSPFEYVASTKDSERDGSEEVLVPGIRTKYETIARMLKRAGANMTAVDAHGKTAVDYVHERDNEKLVAMLVGKPKQK